MRRGTPAAIEFGKWIEDVRVKKGLSMRKVGEAFGTPAATISQIERAQRALKEPKIDKLADALGISRRTLRAVWVRAQQNNPDPPLVRRRAAGITTKTLQQKLDALSARERSQVIGYIDRILEERNALRGE